MLLKNIGVWYPVEVHLQISGIYLPRTWILGFADNLLTWRMSVPLLAGQTFSVVNGHLISLIRGV